MNTFGESAMASAIKTTVENRLIDRAMDTAQERFFGAGGDDALWEFVRHPAKAEIDRVVAPDFVQAVLWYHSSEEASPFVMVGVPGDPAIDSAADNALARLGLSMQVILTGAAIRGSLTYLERSGASPQCRAIAARMKTGEAA